MSCNCNIFCFSVTQKESLGRFYKAILTQLNQAIRYINGACIWCTSRHRKPILSSWLSCRMRVMLFFGLETHVHYDYLAETCTHIWQHFATTASVKDLNN
jgi:hypothetical protein